MHDMFPRSCDCLLLTLYPRYTITSGLVSSTGYVWFSQEANIHAFLNPNID